jgi:hypothetical protein
LQGAKIHDGFEQELKETISWVRKNQYERMLAMADGEGATRELDRKIRTDSQLTQDDQARLLAEVNGDALG